MKKSIKIINVLLVGFLFTITSCASSKTVESSNKDVETKNDIQSSSETNKEYVIDNDVNAMDFKIERKQKTFLSNFGTSSKFVEYDSVGVFASNGFGGMKNTEAIMVYVPESETFGFGANYLAAYYYVHFDEDGRKAFVNAVNQYFNDFENKRLQRDSGKTISAYGTSDVYVNWGSLKSACSNNGTGKISYGYKFVDRSPYFMISFSHIYNKRYDNDNVAPVESLNVTYYFTKEYCKNMALDLTDASVNAVLNEYKGVTSVFADDYSEKDEY